MRGFVVAALFCSAIATVNAAPLQAPLQIAAGQPVINEFGQVIQGDATVPDGERPLVHILWVNDGIHPPQLNGQPHPNNPLMIHGETSIGTLVAPSMINSGLFGASIANPRPTSGEIFVRVYNAATIDESTFYGDSDVMDVPSANTPLFAYVGPVTNIVDRYRDTDLDGLPDWWEHLNFGHRTAVTNANVDLDGDGMTVSDEFIAGTDPNDSGSTFYITTVKPYYSDTPTEVVWTNKPPPDGDGMVYTNVVYDILGHVVEWPSVAERLYALEFSTNLLSGFVLVPGAGDVVATPNLNVFTNAPPPTDGPVFYRARVRMDE